MIKKSRLDQLPLKQRILALLNSKRVDEASQYVERGRPYQALSDNDLHEHWLRTMRAWGNNPRDQGLQKLQDDLSSEYLLRGREAPLEEVPDVLERLANAAADQLKRVGEETPERLTEINSELEDELQQFLDKKPSRRISKARRSGPILFRAMIRSLTDAPESG